MSAVLWMALALPAGGEEVRELFPSGEVRAVYEIRRGADGESIRHGRYVEYHAGGEVAARGGYEDGSRSGEWTFHWEDGTPREEGRYEQGRRSGEWTAWDEAGEVDAKRSGTYEWDVVEQEGLPRGEGPVLGGARHGPWTWRYELGPWIECTYDLGLVQGPLRFYHADGTYEPELFSAFYERSSRRAQGVEPAPSRESARAYAPLESERDVAALVERALAGDEDARVELLARPREAFPGLVNRLGACDLSDPSELASARRIHGLLGDACGGLSYPWSDEGAPRAAQRWRTFWVLHGHKPMVWEVDLALARRFEGLDERDTVLWSEWSDDLSWHILEGRIGGGAGYGREPFPKGDYVDALENGIQWLLGAQSDDGSWRADEDGFPSPSDVSVTAHALLALRCSRTYRDDPAIPRAVGWLVAQQDPRSGRLAATDGPEGLRQHALATWALAEASYRLGTPALEHATRRAVAYLVGARDEQGLWEHGSATAIATLALVSASEADFELEEGTLNAVLPWLDRITDSATGAARRARPGVEASEPPHDITGLAVLGRVFLGQPMNPSLERHADYLAANVPELDPTTDLESLVYGSLAAYQLGGDAWRRWLAMLKREVVTHRHRAGPRSGSWDPAGRVVTEGGRALATALMVQALQTPRRFARLLR